MAIASSFASKRSSSPDQKGKVGKGVKTKEEKSRKRSEDGCDLPVKRSKGPGVRVIHGRIYDSEHGKTCHQCRQKTRDFVASCKNQKTNDQQCTINFCHKCLLNRYGEKAEEVAVLKDWSCPKCRGICNCSFCMKKRGHQPTGILVHTAKATGFSSVSQLLHIQGSENLDVVKNVKAEPIKRGKENSFSGNGNLNSHSIALPSIPNGQKLKTMKQSGLKEKENGNRGDGIFLNETSHVKPQISNERLKKTHHRKQTDGVLAKGGLKDTKEDNQHDEILLKETNTRNPPVSKQGSPRMQDSMGHNVISMKEVKTNRDVIVPEDEKNLEVSVSDEVSSNLIACKKSKDHKDSRPYKVEADALKLQNNDIDVDILLPQGAEVTTVAGVDLPTEDVGYALQFLEFCTAFNEILDLKQGEPSKLLRELMHGRRGRPGKYSPAVQFHIQLLSMILEDLGEDSEAITQKNGKNSWLHALQKCASRSQSVLKKLKLDLFGQEADDYDSLDSSQRLRLLVFLCDEVLCTEHVRSWIDDQNSKIIQNVKETKEKILAAKHKEKQLKQKMLDEVAKAIIARNGAPLSISEHEAVVLQIKTEVAQARAEIMKSKDIVPNGIKGSAAVRTEPILLDSNGRTYWKLNGYSDNSNVLLQDVATSDAVESSEKWFTFDVEQEREIEEYISSRR
ncbi:hypothetical protein RHMOL_Rhmol08G0091200 [Rhododendron molle]|uniref:Uncharacterized protein n=1 Tax=Rhododendron molle TaxID=49168 RepID=A0ACC0MMW8_RHOML|nr:hypothetical protein RHMOL_Rhmol08G0091200 [Rhododendron molle]